MIIINNSTNKVKKNIQHCNALLRLHSIGKAVLLVFVRFYQNELLGFKLFMVNSLVIQLRGDYHA